MMLDHLNGKIVWVFTGYTSSGFLPSDHVDSRQVFYVNKTRLLNPTYYGKFFKSCTTQY